MRHFFAMNLQSFKRHPLEMAAIHNRADVIDLLVKHHADVNKKGPSGYTPLHRACMWGAKQAVEALLKHNANPMYVIYCCYCLSL